MTCILRNIDHCDFVRWMGLGIVMGFGNGCRNCDVVEFLGFGNLGMVLGNFWKGNRWEKFSWGEHSFPHRTSI